MSADRDGDLWPFWILFGMQTLGTGLLHWYVIPLYRQVLADPTVHEAELRPLLWGLPSITLMQLGYWISYRTRPPLPQVVQPVVAHLVLCAAQFVFILSASAFTLVFLAPPPGFSIPLGRSVLTILGMFAVFCYTLELNRLGRALLGSTRSE